MSQRSKEVYKLCINCYNCKKKKNGKIKCSEGHFDEIEERSCICSPLDYDCPNYED